MVTRNDKSAHQVVKPTKSELTRSGLLVAAAKKFSDRDYSDVTLNDIARRSGMTKGAVYFHFATKEEVAGAVSYIYDHRLRVLYAKVQSEYDDSHINCTRSSFGFCDAFSSTSLSRRQSRCMHITGSELPRLHSLSPS